jgi:hypothetical protein
MRNLGVSRRRFGKVAIGLLPMIKGGIFAATSDLDWRRQRQKLAHRRRRLTYNDDGGVPGPAPLPKDFLSRRFDWTKDTHVDSYCWNTKPSWFYPEGYFKNVSDPARATFDAARAAGMEAVATMRMNDIHEAFAKELFYPFKIQHRKLLMEPEGASGKYSKSDWRHWYWASMNFARAEVREHKLGIIFRLCEKYFPDAFEMDFMRGPVYFKRGEEAANLPVMTAFVRRVRRRLDEMGRQRGHPILLSARVTDTPETSVRLGLDVPTWLREGLLDLLIVGLGYAPCGGAWKEYAALAHRYEVPVYPVIDSCLVEQTRGVQPQRGAAMNMWHEGADGIYLFNAFVPVDGINILSPEMAYGEFKRLGSIETLEGLDKTFCQDDAGLDQGGKAIWALDAQAEMPVPTLITVPYRTIPLLVGEDFSRVPKDKRRRLTLRLKMSSGENGAHLQVRVNGQHLGMGKPVTQGWVEYDVQVPPLKRGTNHVAIALTQGEEILQALQLEVRYLENMPQS